MTKEVAQFLKDAMENAGEDCDLRAEYGGRGMGDKTTMGIVIDHIALLIPALIEHTKDVIENGGEIPDIPSFQVDNMGKGVIVY